MILPAEVSERDLVLRTRDGESAAFGELVQRHMQRAYYSALGLVGSPEDARDLSQEAFVRAYRARGRLDRCQFDQARDQRQALRDRWRRYLDRRRPVGR